MVQRFTSAGSLLAAGVLAVSASIGVAAQAPKPAPAPAGPPAPCGPGVEGKNIAQDSRCFELRTYTVRAEGPGSIDLLHARFREHTNRLFRKHGMEIVGFWQPTNKGQENTLIYLLAYKDRAARDKAWEGFRGDPEWAQVTKKMQVSSQVDSIFLVSTDYGPMK